LKIFPLYDKYRDKFIFGAEEPPLIELQRKSAARVMGGFLTLWRWKAEQPFSLNKAGGMWKEGKRKFFHE